MDKYQWTYIGMSITAVENGPARYVREFDYDVLQAKVEEQRKHIDIMATALSEIKATDDGDSAQEIGTILGWSIEQLAALKQESE